MFSGFFFSPPASPSPPFSCTTSEIRVMPSPLHFLPASCLPAGLKLDGKNANHAWITGSVKKDER